jgi:CRISPR-associated protein Csy1
MPDFVVHNRPEKLFIDLSGSNFYLAYQGLDDKPLQVSYAQFVAGMLNSVAPQFMQPLARKDAAGRRLRIGFLSSFFKECTVSRYFGSWITRIGRERFETFVYHTYPEQDGASQAIAAASDHFRHLTGQQLLPQNLAAELLADDLDILVYPELGMDSIYFLLAAMRLAPLQCAGWGHPVTSGHANIDCYFSSAAMEPDDAQAHYSERLVLLDGIGTWYSKPVLPAAKQRADFALPEGRTLYLCPQSLFKIHPDNDALLARVLERDPNGVLVLFAGRHPDITGALFRRLTQAMRARGIDPKDRGVILPPVSHADYLCINMLCDVMLDTLHWSGGNTSLDAIACSLPVVTLPGEFMRGRQSYAMLKLIGLDELIAADQDDYVEIATRLGTDRAWRNEVARHLSVNCDVIFNKETALRQMEQFYIAQFSA